MKKFLFGLLVIFCGSMGFIFAQGVIFPDSAEIDVKGTIYEGEATNMTVTMMKAGSKMTTYTGTIMMKITDENGGILNRNEYVLPNHGLYQFLSENLGSMEFQKGLEIKKVGRFYIEISDYNDDDDKVLGRKLINVERGNGGVGEYRIEVLSPGSNEMLTDEKLNVIGQVSELPNSTISIYVDGQIVGETSSDGGGMIYQPIPNIEQGNHTLRLECHDIEGKILGSSDNVMFTYMPQNIEGFRGISVEPETDLKVGDVVRVTVNTDEMIESVRMELSDRTENASTVMEKEGIGVFTERIFLVSPGEVSIDLILSYNNNGASKSYKDVKRIYVGGAPEIGEITKDLKDEDQTARISWKVKNGVVSGYFINYWIDGDSNYSGEKWTENEYFLFSNVPYDREISMNITPYWEGQKKHGVASETVRFIIRSPEAIQQSGSMGDMFPNLPKCTVQNISLRTTKIGDSYYLMWDKVENVSKYIVYSSLDEAGKNKTKVYETSDTSYEYPFDHTSETDQFLYFWIVGICDDGEELELSGATRVQVGPAQNFFLLLCLTLLIYFGIKLFKETEV